MNLASVRLVTADVDSLVAFYSILTGITAIRQAPDFAEVHFPGGALLAISSERLVKQFNAGAAIAASNRSAIVELQLDTLDEVDATYTRLGSTVDTAMPPSTMPWGNRSMLLRDPDGNLVNIFARPRAA